MELITTPRTHTRKKSCNVTITSKFSKMKWWETQILQNIEDLYGTKMCTCLSWGFSGTYFHKINNMVKWFYSYGFLGLLLFLQRLVHQRSQISYFYYSHFTPWFSLNYHLPVLEDILFTLLFPCVIALLDMIVSLILENNNLQIQGFLIISLPSCLNAHSFAAFCF